MNKTMHSNNTNTSSVTIERPLNAKYYPLNDEDLNGRQLNPQGHHQEQVNLLVRLTIKVLSAIGFDL